LAVARTHYETLGLKRTATAGEIKSAYRKIVLSHHPDRSKDPRSTAVFLSATEAYDVLSDSAAKLRYDESLDHAAKMAAERVRQSVAQATPPQAARPASPPPGWTQTARPDTATIAADVLRLTQLFARGRHAEAEKLAREIAKVAPKNPTVYAVLGDIARLQGNLNEAAKMYAYAAQFEPNNPVYQRRYEELLTSTRIVEDRRMHTQLESEDAKVLAPMAGGAVILATAIYVGVGHEAAVFGKVPFISTWTIGLAIMLLLSGIGVGASLAMGNMLDRFQSVATTATGRAGPTVALGLVAIVNFWAAVLLYLLLGAFQRAFNFSTTRTVTGVALATSVLAIAAAAGHRIDGMQVLTWGGNLVYVGTLIGWLVADAFRA
jgi:tetratricopeptide (TPR) repeat protein